MENPEEPTRAEVLSALLSGDSETVTRLMDASGRMVEAAAEGWELYRGHFAPGSSDTWLGRLFSSLEEARDLWTEILDERSEDH